MNIIARPFYKLPLFGKVKSIELHSDEELLARCEVTTEGKSLGKFELVRTDTIGKVTVKFKDKLREEFEIIDNIENCRWTCDLQKPDTWISFFPKPMTIKSDSLSGEFSSGGLIYLNNKCIGRIGESSKYPFGRRLEKIEVKDETYLNFLMSISLVKVLQSRVYKIQDRGI